MLIVLMFCTDKQHVLCNTYRNEISAQHTNYHSSCNFFLHSEMTWRWPNICRNRLLCNFVW